VTCHRQRSTKL